MRAGDWLIVSGQIGLVDGALVPGGRRGRVPPGGGQHVALLEGEGSRLADVRKTTVFLRHMRDYSIMNTAYAELFPRAVPGPLGRSPCPSCRFVALVEIEAWAYVGY